MKFKSVLLLSLALGCGLVAMLGVQQMLSGGHRGEDENNVKVLVAKQDIAPGVPLDETNVVFQDWAREKVPQGAVTEEKQYHKRASKVPLYAGEVILQPKLGEENQIGASSSIPKGMRLISFPVNSTQTNSNMIQPGDRVDILVTYNVTRPGAPSISRTKTVLEYIELFAIDRVRNADATDSSKATKAENVSVLVTKEQMTVLQHAKSKGVLQLALRNLSDKAESKIAPLDDDAFEGLATGKGRELDQAEDAEEGPKTAGVDGEKSPGDRKGFKDFLKKKDTPKTATAQTGAPQTPAAADDVPKNTWIIEIFEGHTKRIEKIELPGVPGDAAATPPAPLPAETPVEKPIATAA